MTAWSYLATLGLGLCCMVVTDRRWRLVLWADARRGATVLAAGVLVFLAWDLAALRLGLYRRGESGAMTGVSLAPDLPLEEIFFILFLCYLTLVLHRLVRAFVLPDTTSEGGRR